MKKNFKRSVRQLNQELSTKGYVEDLQYWVCPNCGIELEEKTYNEHDYEYDGDDDSEFINVKCDECNMSFKAMITMVFRSYPNVNDQDN